VRNLIPNLLLSHLLIRSLRCSTPHIQSRSALTLNTHFAFQNKPLMAIPIECSFTCSVMKALFIGKTLSPVGTLWGEQQVTFGRCLIRSTIDVGIVPARLGNCTKRKPAADRIYAIRWATELMMKTAELVGICKSLTYGHPHEEGSVYPARTPFVLSFESLIQQSAGRPMHRSPQDAK
jgi:hypothetical protein